MVPLLPFWVICCEFLAFVVLYLGKIYISSPVSDIFDVGLNFKSTVGQATPFIIFFSRTCLCKKSKCVCLHVPQIRWDKISKVCHMTMTTLPLGWFIRNPLYYSPWPINQRKNEECIASPIQKLRRGLKNKKSVIWPSPRPLLGNTPFFV